MGGRENSFRVLLVFPPLNALITHPELGLPQLTAYLKGAGLAVRQEDLNVRFIYDYMRRPLVWERLSADLDGQALTRLKMLHDYWRKLIPEIRSLLGGPSSDNNIVSRYLVQMENSLPPHFLKRGNAASTETSLSMAERQQIICSLAEERDFPWSAWHLFMEFIQNEYIEPDSYSPEDIERTVERPCPIMDDFLDRHLYPLLHSDLKVLGLSLHTSRQLAPALRIASRARKLFPDLHIVAGGPWCSVASDLIRREPFIFKYVDSVVPYEGEIPLTALTQALQAGQPLDGVPGRMYSVDGRVSETAAPTPPTLETLPVPDFTDLPWELYPERLIPFRTIRGCYWGKCIFCYHVLPQNSSFKPPEAMSRQHLDRLVETVRNEQMLHKISAFTMADNATPPVHLEQIATRLIEEKLTVSWQAMTRFHKDFTPELCALLARSGCLQLHFGLETSSRAELRRINKGITPAMALSCLHNCRETGIEASVFMLDYPSLASEDYEAGLKFVLEHAQYICNLLPFRFQLGRNSAVFSNLPAFGIHPDSVHNRCFSVFDVPFEADGWKTEQGFKDISSDYYIRFLRLRHAMRHSNDSAKSEARPRAQHGPETGRDSGCAGGPALGVCKEPMQKSRRLS